MEERISDNAPQEIEALLHFPYQYFLEDLISCYGKEISILDIACGEAKQWLGKTNKIRDVVLMDINPASSIVQKASILDIPLEDSSVSFSFCFETIEHLKKEDQAKAIKELDRVSSIGFIVGSINRDGPTYINGVEIYKGDRNPYHLQELGILDFPELFINFQDVELFRSMYSVSADSFEMFSGLTDNGYCNYGAVLTDA